MAQVPLENKPLTGQCLDGLAACFSGGEAAQNGYKPAGAGNFPFLLSTLPSHPTKNSQVRKYLI